jgi:hypothetical protein
LDAVASRSFSSRSFPRMHKLHMIERRVQSLQAYLLRHGLPAHQGQPPAKSRHDPNLLIRMPTTRRQRHLDSSTMKPSSWRNSSASKNTGRRKGLRVVGRRSPNLLRQLRNFLLHQAKSPSTSSTLIGRRMARPRRSRPICHRFAVLSTNMKERKLIRSSLRRNPSECLMKTKLT